MIFIAWLVFSICIGILATNWKNRSPIKWGLLAMVVSPLLAGIALLVVQNLSHERKATEARGTFNIEKFCTDMKAMKDLLDKKVYTLEEFTSRRQASINALYGLKLNGSLDSVLLNLTNLVEVGTLTQEELLRIKEIFQRSAQYPVKAA